RESSAKSEPFSQPFELPGRAADHQPRRPPSVAKEHGSCQGQQGGPWVTGAAAGPSSESILSYEKVFRFAFQEVPVEQATEDVCSLDHFLEKSSEENTSLASVPRLCSESRKLWRALQNTDTGSASPCLWSESHCRENLFPVLGIDATQKSGSGGQDHVLEGSDLRKPEELLAVSSFHLHHCKALIQTKLSGTSGSRQGSLITYSLFLKTPLQGNGHYTTIPQKKIFTPRNLKMAFFSNGVC
ncbi:Uncharacterized protein C14orf79-like, partial [Cricetulus griseus]